MTVSKSRSHNHTITRNGDYAGTYSNSIESISTDRFARRKASCFHWKLKKPFSGRYCTDQDTGEYFDMQSFYGFTSSASEAAAVGFQHLYDLKGYTMPGQSGFEILTFAADFDDTLKMIGESFVRLAKAAVVTPRSSKAALKKAAYVLPSYGEATWGWVPFVSDIKSAIKGLIDILSDKGQDPYCQPFNVKRNINFSRPKEGVVPSLTVEGSMRTHGTLCVRPPAHLKGGLLRAMRMLDAIGFNPDLKSAWDIIPLSFVLDYFVPVGDLLESLHPRGWVNYETSGDGWSSFDITFRMGYSEPTLRYLKHPDWYIDDPIIEGEVYSRGLALIPASSVKTLGQDPPKWEAPSLRELLNTAYLAKR